MDSVTALKNAIGVDFIKFGLPIIIGAGCFGNCLSFIVYSRKFFAKTSCGFYLRVLSVTDTMVCLVYICSFLSRGLGVNVKAYSAVNCKIIWYLYYVPTAYSSMIEALVCFDRMVNITAPSKYNLMKKSSFMFLVIACIVVYDTLVYIPLLFYYDLVDNLVTSTVLINGTKVTETVVASRSCTMTSDLYSNVLSWFDLINQVLVPFLIMLVCTIITLTKIYKVRTSISKQICLTTTPSSKKIQGQKQRDLQFAITSVSLCLMFFTLNVGSYVYDLLLSYDMIPSEDIQIGFGTTFFFFIADYGVKFYVYLIVNRHFLFEFKNMLRTDVISIIVGTSGLNSMST